MCLVAVLLASCSDSKPSKVQQTAEAVDEEPAVVPTAEDDDLLPKGAEELFDDFMMSFASNERLQRRRIVFPLKVTAGRRSEAIDSVQWQMDSFFLPDDGYTLIFDSPEQQELVSDTSVNRAMVEKFYLDRDSVCQYMFSRTGGRWHLNELRRQRLAENANGAFLSFYSRFAADSVFQQHSLADKIEFSGPDPDDDFEQLEGFITPGSWDAFAPDLPQGNIYNIVYGQQNPRSQQRIFVIRSIDGGESIELTFEKKRGSWRLTKLTE